jgi:hypothetical protein
LLFRQDFFHGYELPHDILCRCAATTTAEPPEPFGSFVINVLFNQNILQAVVGPAARQSVKKSVYSV